MAVDRNTFRVNYPEFTNAPDALIDNELANAYLLTPIGIWADRTDMGAQLRAAQALALSPFGRNMELSSAEGKTLYDGRLRILTMIVAGGGSLL